MSQHPQEAAVSHEPASESVFNNDKEEVVVPRDDGGASREDNNIKGLSPDTAASGGNGTTPSSSSPNDNGNPLTSTINNANEPTACDEGVEDDDDEMRKDSTALKENGEVEEEKDGEEVVDNGSVYNPLPASKGLSSEEAEKLLEEYGRNELAENKTSGWIIFLRGLWGPMPIAIWIAIIIEFALQNWPDGSILFGILIANATIGWYETMKAGDAVAALRNSLKPNATVYRDGKWHDIDAAILVPGDLVKLAAGSAVPADCSLNEGEIEVDEAALTGESLPVTMHEGHVAKMGSTVVRGEVDGTVQFTGSRTFFGKTALLISSVAADLGNIHYVLVKVMIVLTSVSLVLCLTCFGYLMGEYKLSFKEALEFVVVLLVVSVPIAIEIVITTALALGSKELSIQKVIVTRLSSIEMMSAVNMLCSDKTGTLTLNKMEIQETCHTFSPDHNKDSVLVLAALAAKWREPPRDALDTMVLGAANLEECDNYEQLEFLPFNPKVKRTEATLRRNEVTFKVTKGAPKIVTNLCHNAADIQPRVTDIITELASRGIRCLGVARTLDEDVTKWEMAGILTFLDPPRPDTKETIRKSKEYGVDVKMITGDNQLIAREMARMLDMDTNIETPEDLPQFPASGDPKDIPDTLGRDYGDMMLACGGFAHVFPEHKYLIVETLRQFGYTVAMTGDGVNDAPALKRADVGIAVHGATDAARAAADMVLTDTGLSVVVDAMLIARGVFQRMLSFLIYRVSATLQLLCFFFLGVFILPTEDYGINNDKFQFFRLPVLMFMLITLLNDGTLMTIGYDNVRPSAHPQRWNLRVVFLVAGVLAAVALTSSLLLLWMCLDAVEESHWQSSWFKGLGIGQIRQGHVVTILYLKVSISDFLTLFSARTGSHFFFAFRPSLILFLGATISLIISTIVATFWPDSTSDGIEVSGLMHGDTRSVQMMPLWIWIYCVFWWFVQDLAKVGTYMILDCFNIFGYQSHVRAHKGEIHPTEGQAHLPKSQNNSMVIRRSNSGATRRGGRTPQNSSIAGSPLHTVGGALVRQNQQWSQ